MFHVYICACSPDGGIYHYCLTQDGILVYQDQVNLDRPMYAIQSGHVLYVLLRAPFPDSDNSGLLSIPLDTNGKMGTPSSVQNTHGSVAAHLCMMNSDLFVANYLSGNILKVPNLSVQHIGIGIDPVRQSSPHPHFVTPTPDRQYIAVVDLGLDTIFTYTSNLELCYTAHVPPGSGCRHLVFSPDGHYSYCVNELSSDISIFQYIAGKFQLLQTVPALPADQKNSMSIAAAIRCTEEYVYVSHRGYNKISQFRRIAGQLYHCVDLSCGGDWPRDFQLAGAHIVCTNEKSNTVSVIHQGKVLHHVPLPSPICVSITT